MKGLISILVVLFVILLCGPVLGEWTQPVFLEELNDTVSGYNASGQTSLSSDGLSLYFTRYVPGYNGTTGRIVIHEAKRAVPSGPFTSTEIRDDLSDGVQVQDPLIMPDNLRMYYSDFVSDWNEAWIRTASRSSVSSSWVKGRLLTEIHADGYHDGSPTLTGDELTIFWTSDRPGADGANAIWTATRDSISDPFSNVTPVAELNSSGVGLVNSPCVLRDGLTIYFGFQAPESPLSECDIYKATRQSLDEPFGNIQKVGSDIISTSDFIEWGVEVTPDERTIYFYSERGEAFDQKGIWVSYWSEPFDGVYHVDTVSGSDDNDGLTHETAFATIGKGVDVAADGDTVLVWPGVYFESVDFGGKAITVASAADAAVIDGGGDVVVSGQVETSGQIGIDSEVGFGGVVFQSQEGPDSVLSHFVIQNWTAGVFGSGSSPTIQHVTVVNNDYGAMAFGGGDPEISNSIFWYNVYEDLSQCETMYSLVEDEVGPVESAISYWPLDEGQGAIAGDIIGGNDGTVTGAQWDGGAIGGALSFDGDGDSVDMGDQDSLDFDADDSFSLSAWIKGDKSDAMMFAKRDVDDAWFHHEGYQFKVYEDKLLFVIEDDGERAVSIVGDSIVDDNQWHHVVAVRDAQADMVYLYVDGGPDAVPVADTTTTTLATDCSFLAGGCATLSPIFPRPYG